MTTTATARCQGSGSRLISNGRTSTRIPCATCRRYHAPPVATSPPSDKVEQRTVERTDAASFLAPKQRAAPARTIATAEGKPGAGPTYITPRPYEAPAPPMTSAEKFEASRPGGPAVPWRKK